MSEPVIQVAVGICIALTIALGYGVVWYLTQPPDTKP
jgi:hypothetical protein